MPMDLFSAEYEFIKDCLEKGSQGAFHDPLKKHIDAMKNILGAEGPDIGYSSKLSAMRTALLLKQSTRIMKSAGIDTKSAAGSVAESAVVKAATIKFLKHLHMVKKRGNQKIWVFSSPAAYSQYPTDELLAVKNNKQGLKAKLADNKERFSSKDKRNLSDATQLGLRWATQAWIVLANSKTKGGEASRAKIEKWFADLNTTDDQLDTVITQLQSGFKKITDTLNSTQLIFTDMASLRYSNVGDDPDYRASEAFVFAGRYEKLPIVYIEDAFFEKGGNVTDGIKNWARIIVHELTHLDCSTDDKRYAWAGIRPGLHISGAECAVNADSWAYFAADCARALTDSDVARAMEGI